MRGATAGLRLAFVTTSRGEQMFEASQASRERPARVAVIYYSARGNTHALARAVAEGAEREGAEVRLRPVAELNQEMVLSVNQHWGRHRSEIGDVPESSKQGVVWGAGIAFGETPGF